MANLARAFFNFQNSNDFREEYVLLDSNKHSFFYISKWPNWQESICLIYGGKKTGKTHLCNFWQHKAKAVALDIFNYNKSDLKKTLKKHKNFIIDNFDKYFIRKYQLHNLDNNDFDSYEETFIEIMDEIRSKKGYLLLSSSTPINQINIKTEDLESRVTNITSISLEESCRKDKERLLKKLLNNYQISLTADIIEEIVKKSDSLAYIVIIVQKINNLPFENRENVNFEILNKIINTLS